MALTKAVVLMKLREDMRSGSNKLGWRYGTLHWLVHIKMYALEGVWRTDVSNAVKCCLLRFEMGPSHCVEG